ncbi:P-loop containing nucleoside triphosphate hydrolase [Phytophthora cactorum]|nr:P-loop containing nucleoside triphosphate hydrolase [Phytophthora cactorum]
MAIANIVLRISNLFLEGRSSGSETSAKPIRSHTLFVITVLLLANAIQISTVYDLKILTAPFSSNEATPRLKSTITSDGGRGDEVGEDAPAFEGISSRNRSTESWPWVEKYRPSSLDDLIAHQEIISTLNRLIDAQKLPHLLFYGPPGTGKTSMIIAAARRL